MKQFKVWFLNQVDNSGLFNSFLFLGLAFALILILNFSIDFLFPIEYTNTTYQGIQSPLVNNSYNLTLVQ